MITNHSSSLVALLDLVLETKLRLRSLAKCQAVLNMTIVFQFGPNLGTAFAVSFLEDVVGFLLHFPN